MNMGTVYLAFFPSAQYHGYQLLAFFILSHIVGLFYYNNMPLYQSIDIW